MKSMSGFETAGNRGFYRPRGVVSDGQLADMVTEALRHANAAGLRDLLINLSLVNGFETPGVAYRRWVARRWARAVEGALRVAVVAQEAHICPEKTGLLVAAEEGLHAHICIAESEASAWLDAAR